MWWLAVPLAAAGSVAAAWWAGLPGEAAVRWGAEPAPGRVSRVEAGVARAAEGCGSAPDRADAWVEALGARGDAARAGRVEELLAAPEGLRLLILPETACLERDAQRRVLDYVDAGGGVVAVGRVGTTAPRARAADWGFLERLTGAQSFFAVESDMADFVSVRAGSPLAVGLTGLRLQPAEGDRIAAVVLGHHPYWSRADLAPADPALPASYQVAALHRSRGGGRVVWLGFDPLVPGERIARLLSNALDWSAGVPLAELGGWPHPHRSAASLIVNLAANPADSGYAARGLRDSGLRGSFLVPRWFLDDGGALSPLVPRQGDVEMGDLAPSGAGPRATLDLELARARYRWAWGVWPFGASAAERSAPTIELLARAGLDHVILSGESDSVRPKLAEVEVRWGPLSRTRRVALLTRIYADDLNLSPMGLTGLRPDWIVRRVLADHDVVADLGGAYLLLVHTQGLSAPDRGEELLGILAAWQERSAWVVSAGELARWWLDRARLTLRVAEAAPGALVIELTSSSGHAVRDVAALVHPPGTAPWRVAAGGCQPGEAKPGEPVALRFPEVRPGATARCELRSAP